MNHGARRTEGDGVNRCWPRLLWLIELVGGVHKAVTQQSLRDRSPPEVERLDLKRLTRSFDSELWERVYPARWLNVMNLSRGKPAPTVQALTRHPTPRHPVPISIWADHHVAGGTNGADVAWFFRIVAKFLS